MYLKAGCLLVMFFGLALSCAPELSPEEQELQKLEQELKLQTTPERANAYLDALTNFVANNRDDFEYIKPFLVKGANTAREQGFQTRIAGFIVPLVKGIENPSERLPHLIDLGDLMYQMNLRHASDVIYKALYAQYPDDPKIQERASLIDSLARVKPDYVGYLFDQILIEPDDFGVNRAAAMKFVDAAEALAMAYPENSNVPDYLYKAGEVARSRRDLIKSMTLYDWILEKYPDYENAPTVLFIKGFILEQDMEQEEEARVVYQEFLTKYPGHQMAESAQFLLDNLGKSEEEILRFIEEQRISVDSAGMN